MMHNRGVVLGMVLFLVIGASAWAKTPIRPAVDLDQLLGPIALYPDPVLAQILPAATAPEDLALAVKFLEDGGDLGQVDAQPWNDNAKALARWPEILRMMNRSRDWTDAVGTAFWDQPKDVMDSIQRLRTAAVASGALQTTREQRVVAEKGIVCIYPDDPEAIHLPQYDPNAVYAPQSSPGGGVPITFESVLVVGYWLNYELDWRKHRVYSYDSQEFPYGRRNPWYFGGQSNAEVLPNIPKQRNREWEPDKNRPRPFASLDQPLPAIQTLAGTVEAPKENEPAPPATESRPLAAPKDLAPPPPMLTPVDPAMDPPEESPAAKSGNAARGAQKPVERAPQTPKAAEPRPAAAKPAPEKPVKAKSVETVPAPAKTGKARAAETKSEPAKAGKEKAAGAKPVPAQTGKGKAAEEKSAPAKGEKAGASETKPAHARKGKVEPAEEKAEETPVPAKSRKAKTVGEKPAPAKTEETGTVAAKASPAKAGKAKPAKEEPAPAKAEKAKPAATKSPTAKPARTESGGQKPVPAKSKKAKPADAKQSTQEKQ